MNNFHLIENFKKGDKIGVIRLNQPIATDEKSGITGASFSRNFDHLVASGVEKIVIPINSIGGNVFNGLEIYSTIQDSPIPTETRVVGIAASIAGIISQAGTKRTIKRHGTFHAHATRAAKGASVGNDLLKLTTDSIKSVIAANSTLKEEEIDAIFSGETLMNADNAKNAGLFDEILEGSRKAPLNIENMNPTELMNVFNEIEGLTTKETTNKNKMHKVNALLDLQADASEKSQIEAITTLKADAAKVDKLAEVEASLLNKDEEIAQLKTELEASNVAKATSLIEAAISEGKIDGTDETAKAAFIKNATNDFEATSAMLSGITAVVASQKVTDTLKTEVEGAENRKDWTFEEWSKNDPEGLDKMQIKNKVEFDKLLNAYTDK